jgi:S-adenosylmethionine:tRNA ribosyltransferase-isomerase
VLDRDTGETRVGTFRDVLDVLAPGDVLVVNETRVLPARLLGTRAGTGGRVELLLVRPAADGTWLALARPGRALREGTRVEVGDATLEIAGRDGALHRVRYDGDWMALLERHGHVPLPPYIRREDEASDRERYQTVYARVPGAIAAPTAGLHFTPELLAEAERRGVAIAKLVLHVGPGTFKPVTADVPSEHVLDAEEYDVPEETADALASARRAGGRIVAVGTTVTRALETAAAELSQAERSAGRVVRAGHGWTGRLIVPPYRFLAVDALVTNFHLPKSSLLFLVSALAGRERVLAAYARAIAEGFRFYSYGDAMLVIGSRPALRS